MRKAWMNLSLSTLQPISGIAIAVNRVLLIISLSRYNYAGATASLVSQQLNLSQPGLTDAPAREKYRGYELTYKVEPYPQKAEMEIAADEYRLLIVVNLAPTPLQTEADFTGWVTEIHPIGDKGTLGQILVESHADKIVDKYMVTIKDETLILQQDGENHHEVDFEALETTQKVQVWFTGPILESFPMQATAKQVMIIE